MIGVIIQARNGSTRLPGKVLLKLGSKVILEHMIERCKAIPLIDEVIVATTDRSQDDDIEQEALRCGAQCFRGSEDHVLSRFYLAASKYQLQTIVRITADCPYLDPALSNDVIEKYLSGGYDYCSNGLTNSFPRGLDTEVFSFQALERAYQEATSDYDREHVTAYIYRHPDQFAIYSYEYHEDYSHLRWTLDTPEDWTLIQKIYEKMTDTTDYSWSKILRIVTDNNHLNAINAHVKQETEIGKMKQVKKKR